MKVILSFGCLLALAGNALGTSDPKLPIATIPLDVSADKEVLCDASKKPDAELKIDMNADMMDYDDLLRLTVWNSKHNLRSGKKMLEFPPEVNWKRNVLSKLETLFTSSCPAELVPPAFISVARELFMIYQNSLNGSMDHSENWGSFLQVLGQCQEKAEMMAMQADGFRATGVTVATKDGQSESIPILPPAEAADSSSDIDVVIDTMWWLFSFCFGNCYWISHTPSIWASRYKRLFYMDFLNDLKSRWLHAGYQTDFGIIFATTSAYA